MKQKLFTFFLALVASLGIMFASDTKIWYNFNDYDHTASVTYQGMYYDSHSDEYSGNVVIPSSVTYNGKTYSVTSIGSSAFRGCSSLTSVTIPNSVTSIGGNAFAGCSSLTSVHITDLAAWCKISFGNDYANPLSSAHNLYLNGKLVKDLVIPNSVTSIGDLAFRDCSSLTSVTIPNSVASIGSSAFEGCSSLTSVTIPNSVTSIGGYAFEYCSSLTSVTIPNSVTSIGFRAFYGCSSLTSVTINSDAIANKSYDYSSNLSAIFGSQVTKYIIGDNVKGIGKYAFRGGSSLTSITIPNSVTSIGDYAFEDCSSLTSVHITDLAAWCKIGFGRANANPLYYAHNLYLNGELVKDLVIPNSVKSIGDWAFYDCDSLTSVTICNSVTSIGYSAFGGCSNITSVTWNAKNGPSYNFGSQVTSFTFGNEVEVVPSSLCKGMEKLTSVTIPNSVTSIGSGAFYECFSLTSVTIPNSVKTIGSSAFEGCARLGEVSLGKGLETIGANAFAECTRLYDIYSYATYPPFAEESSFANYNAYVYVPCEYKRDYILDVVWGKFKFIECISSEDIENVQGDEVQSTKVIKDGQVLILRNGKTYTMQGQEVK